VLLLAVLSLAFFVIVAPFYAAILWSIVLAITFAPLCRKLAGRRPRRPTLAAIATVAIIVVLVIFPFAVVGTSLIDQATGLFKKIQAGEINFGQYLRQLIDVLPGWAVAPLERFGLADPAVVQERLSTALSGSSKWIAAQALVIGQNTLEFLVVLCVMLYLLFFLLRDGEAIAKEVKDVLPLRPEVRDTLFQKFVIAVRATIKGILVVALVQGTLGGLMFWFLGIPAPLFWGVLMGILSLIPAAGTALVWLPVAIYFLATGALWQGAILLGYGVLVIAMVDNVLSPFLISRDTRMPDYVVLIAILGGIALMGPNGFVVGPLVAAMFIAAWEVFAASAKPAAD
jgi:predicted PurR-regulated permease PerM